MAAQPVEDFIVGEDLDDLFALIDGGFLDDDITFNVELDAVVTEVSNDGEDTVMFRCKQCDKVCKSQRGLTRHCNSKHASVTLQDSATSSSLSKEEEIMKKLHPLALKVIVKNCANLCLNDLCLPEATRCVFSTFSFTNDDAVELWNNFKDIIEKYHGAEKFYTTFYGLLAENLLPSKFEDATLSNILLTEVANHMLIHLSGVNKDVVLGNIEVASPISEKELNSLQYLAGFIIHKLHSKFRFSKTSSSDYNKQCISILQACKVESDDSQTLVNIRDRGGLWKVNKKIQDVFLQCEQIFRSKTSNFTTTLVCKDMVKEMLSNCSVLSNFKSVCYGVDPKVSKEISMNLLEHVLTLFTKVRTFSYAKDIREKHKVAKKSSKKRSLRTEIKKSSTSTDMGH